MLPNKSYYSSSVADLSLSSQNFFDIQQKVKGSVINKSTNFEEQWKIQRAFIIDNKLFARDFNEKRISFQSRGNHFSQWEVRYGFLTTIKESMVHKVAQEGLEVRLCPYNYFGHNISGIHISQNADVCLNEASKKVDSEDEIILIIFKYMFGRHKIVPMYDPNILLAPTPNYDSHLCEDRPDPTETISNQYIKSLVYLYEFENPNLDPTIRPRHCFPVSAIVFKKGRHIPTIDLTVQEPVQSCVSIYDENPVSFLKPIPQSHWGREFLLQPKPLVTSSIVIQKNERDDSRKVLVSEYNGSKYQSSVFQNDLGNQRWEPIGREFGNRNIEDVRDRSVRSRSRSPKNDLNNDDAPYQERDRSFDRLNQWRGTRSNGGLRGGVYFDNGPATLDRFPISEFDGTKMQARNWFR